MIDEKYVYSRVGMALISAQRVEFASRALLEHLAEFDKNVYGITTSEFLSNSRKSKNARKTLGTIFRLHKLNPKLVVEDELDEYLRLRNILVHEFWKSYLDTKSEEQAKKAVHFCNDFGELSNRVERFFRGFLYFVALRHVKDRDSMGKEFKKLDNDFEYFLETLDNKSRFVL